jgi:hypothetical protein
MALTDFFRINFPYGMKCNNDDEWFVFNREYIPLGYNDQFAITGSIDSKQTYSHIPVYTKYKGLTEAAIERLNPVTIQRDKTGKIKFVFFYNDRTNPQSNPKYWDNYFKIIKALSRFERA